MEPTQVKSIVRGRYAKAAVSGKGSCCSSAESLGYDPAALGAVPAEAVAVSLGCGSPVSAARLREGERVLDLGSGGGIDVFLAAREVGAKGHVYGVDMTPEMLERAQAAAARSGLGNVTFLQGEIEALPLPDGAVDVVISNCVINLSPDKPRVFREAFRVLAPGGRFVVADMLATAPLPASVANDPSAWAECIAGAIPEGEYAGALREAGFAEVAVEARDEGTCCEPSGGACCDSPGDSSGDSCCGVTVTDGPRVFSAIITARKAG